MRRWSLRILILLCLLLIAAAVTVQIVLATDVPRRLVINALEEQTGLRFAASSLQTGWRGETEVRNLTIALPLEADPFAEVPQLRISHTDLIRLVLFRDIAVVSAQVDRPRVLVRQDSQGQWNILEAANIVEQRQAMLNGAPGEPPPLPRLDVHHAMVEVTSMTGRQATYGPLSLEGRPDNSLAWSFALQFEQNQIASGRLAPLARWSHQVDFDFQNIHNLVAPWLDEPPPVLEAAGQWRGQITGATLAGQLQLHPLRFDVVSVTGESSIHVTGDRVTIHPSGLIAEIDDQELATVYVRSGAIQADRALIRIERLVAEAVDTSAQIDGEWEPGGESAWANVRWSGEVNGFDAQHDGMLQARLEMPRVGRSVLTASVQSYGSLPEGRWESQWEMGGSGFDWRELAGSINSQRLLVHLDDETIDLSGIAARFRSTWPLVHLTRLDLPGAESRGRGSIDVHTGDWSLLLSASQWTVPGLNQPPLDVHVQAKGVPDRINLDVLRVASEQFDLSAGGVYRVHDDQPLHLRAAFNADLDLEDVHGRVFGDFAVTGLVQPLDLSLSGHVDLRGVSWQGRLLDDSTVPVHGAITASGGSIESSEFAMLQGTWNLRGQYDSAANLATAHLQGSDLAVARIIELAGVPVELSGIADANVDLHLPNVDTALLQLRGSWTARELTGSGLDHAHGSGSINVFENLVRLSDMQLMQDDGVLTGSASMDLDRPRQLLVDAALADWPASLPEHGIDATVNAMTSLEFDVVDLTANGELQMSADVLLDQQHLAHVDFRGLIAGRTVYIYELDGNGFNGRMTGMGEVHLSESDWTRSTLDLQWWDVDLSLLPIELDAEYELVGTGSGTLLLAPSTDIRAPEPLAIELNMQLDDASYGPIELGETRILGFLGPKRLMIQESSSQAIGGEVTFWGRMTRHNGELFTHGHLGLDQIDLQQVADFVGFTDQPVLGRISGSGSAGGYVHQPHRLFGQANLALIESDIANVPGIAQIYSILNVNFGRAEPTGRGEMLLRLEGNSMEITRLTYFNRGTDIVARLRIEDVFAGAASPIDGLAAGTIRPLRELNLPLIGDNLDRLIGAIQSNAATVRVGGTLEDADVAVVPLAEVTGALGRIIRGTPN